MTAAVAAAGPEPPARPTLYAVVDCGSCGRQVAEVRGRDGKPVWLELGGDGRARRDPDGPWWAAKVGGQWRVIQPQPGEDAPSSGVRYAGHQCAGPVAPRLLAERLGAEMVLVADRPRLYCEFPCAGRCGAVVDRNNGTLCDPCTEVLERWRRIPSAQRVSPIPYGKIVDGVYVPRS